jgi:2-polyprenyl-6-methoxyphenol hydroxylase-like FAD-dependent oxidoreductase
MDKGRLMPIKVIIIGAGLGGLCLAHSLRQSSIDFSVFERDNSPWDRAQGYRLHLEADALNALRETLPPDLHSLFLATAQRTEPYTTILDRELRVVKQVPTSLNHDPEHWPGVEEPSGHCNVDRATLRQILLARVEANCHFGKQFVRYEQHAGGIAAFFEDGSVVEGDVLVGADGIRSAVRMLRAPDARIMDSGICAIYGRLPFRSAMELVPKEALEDIFAIASDERKVFLGLGSVRFPEAPDIASARLAEDIELRKRDDYLVCIVGGRHEYFPLDASALNGEELQDLASGLLANWSEKSRSVVKHCDPTSFFFVAMNSSVPCELDAPSNVTLVGDAIHGMTPTVGRGANIAMRDGALLGRQLRAVKNGDQTLADALKSYEQGMLAYGFGVVRESARIGEQRVGQNPLPQ